MCELLREPPIGRPSGAECKPREGKAVIVGPHHPPARAFLDFGEQPCGERRAPRGREPLELRGDLHRLWYRCRRWEPKNNMNKPYTDDHTGAADGDLKQDE